MATRQNTRTTRTCDICLTEFTVARWEVTQNRRRLCSPKCRKTETQQRRTRTCQHCHQAYTPPRHKPDQHFCSMRCHQIDRSVPVSVRLARNSKQAGNGCILWTGSKTWGGYGSFCVDGTMQSAHRAAYEDAVGPIPEGMDVCHRCDNPPCVNPDHLFLGTHSDNMADKVKKGRASRMPGESHPNHKLTEDQVREIRERYDSGSVTQRQLARDFSVTRASIGYIVRRKMWKHV